MIKHHLFTKNRSTATHWYPARNGGVRVRVVDLHPHHLAAIVDQYETEAKKVLQELDFKTEAKKVLQELGFTILSVTSTRVQKFLRKHVPAWPAIKARQREMALNDSALYRELFINKKYSVKREDYYPHQKVALDIENFLGKTPFYPFVGASNPVTPASPKEMLRLKIAKVRIALTELEDTLTKL